MGQRHSADGTQQRRILAEEPDAIFVLLRKVDRVAVITREPVLALLQVKGRSAVWTVHISGLLLRLAAIRAELRGSRNALAAFHAELGGCGRNSGARLVRLIQNRLGHYDACADA